MDPRGFSQPKNCEKQSLVRHLSARDRRDPDSLGPAGTKKLVDPFDDATVCLKWASFPPTVGPVFPEEMSLPIPNDSSRIGRKVFSPSIVAVIAVAAIVAAYFVAITDLDVEAKTRGFSGIIALFLAVTVGLRFLQTRFESPEKPAESRSADVDTHLSSLEEARDVFAGALSPDDTFRLAASRIAGVVPFRTILLYIYDDQADRLRVMHADGVDAGAHRDATIGPRDGQPGDCYCTKRVQIGHESAAIPLESGDSAFGVLQLFYETEIGPVKPELSALEAIGTRVGPLMMSAVAFEKTRATALVDLTTELPNDRAFYAVLENRIAEAQRDRERQPLTVLALDVRGFDDINRRFGHAGGDRVLAFVASVVKENLRQMDFFARSEADEFVAVLPTATKQTSHEVIARIQTGFFGRKFRVTDRESVEVETNVGWATFGADGETPAQLLAAARERKRQAKAMVPPNVIWFPAELVN